MWFLRKECPQWADPVTTRRSSLETDLSVSCMSQWLPTSSEDKHILSHQHVQKLFISSLRWGYKSSHPISWCWHCHAWMKVSLRSLSKTTYLSCGAERLPGRCSGNQRWVEPTTASCWLSSHYSTHTDEHHSRGWKYSRHFTRTTFIWINPSFTVSLPPSLSLYFHCVCVLHSGQAVWALIWKSSGYWVAPRPLGWTSLSDTGRQLEWRTDSWTDWLSNWLDN